MSTSALSVSAALIDRLTVLYETTRQEFIRNARQSNARDIFDAHYLDCVSGVCDDARRLAITAIVLESQTEEVLS